MQGAGDFGRRRVFHEVINSHSAAAWRMRDQAAACERRSHSSRPMRPRRASPNGTSELSRPGRPIMGLRGRARSHAGRRLPSDSGRYFVEGRSFRAGYLDDAVSRRRERRLGDDGGNVVRRYGLGAHSCPSRGETCWRASRPIAASNMRRMAGLMRNPYRSVFDSFLIESRRSRLRLGRSALLRYNDRSSGRGRCGGAVGRGGRPCLSKSIRKAVPCVRREKKAASSDRNVPCGRERSGPFASDLRSSTTNAT